MPIYEYRCQRGHTFEVMQRMADDPVVACETCEAPVARVFHPIAVHFKGSGFYNTDYGTKKRSRELKEAGEAKSKESKAEATSSSGSDAGSGSDPSPGSDSGSGADSKSSKTESKLSSGSSAKSGSGAGSKAGSRTGSSD